MNNTQLIIENLYFKQLLSEEVAFFDQYESLFGDRTKEFFQHYIDGLSAQKELILQLENLEITEQLIQEKFGDQFAAKAAGLGAKARAGINKLATGGKLGGTLGNWVQNKFGVKGSTTDAGNEAYLKARNQNFTRSLGDYLGQLKTFDKSIPDKVGPVPVKMSGWAGGIWQKGKQIASGVGDLAFAGTLLTPAMLTGTAFAGVGGVEKLARKLNEVFDAQWAKLQNLQPVQDFDRLFEVKKKLLRDKLSKIDSSGKETSTILSTIDALGKYGRENPIKSGIIIGLLTFAAAISAGTLGLGVLASSQVFILATAVSFVLRTGLGLLKGESASASVGAGVKTGVATLAGGAPVGATVGAIPSIKNESLMLSNIVQDILSEADPATPAPATAPTTPVTPSAPTLNPNQLKAVENLKFNIGKEISTYLKDVAKTFKVKGASTSELVDNLKKIPQAKTAVDIIESLMAEFPKYKLEFPKDVVVDDKEASTPPTPATPGGGGGGGTAPGGGGGGGGTAPGGGGGGGGTAPGGGGGGGGKTPKPKPGTPDPTTPSTPEPTKPGTPEPAKPGEPEPTKPGEPEPAKPGTPEPKLAGGTPINLTPVLTKQLTSVKQNPLVAGGLANRIKTMSTLKMSNPADAKYAKALLQKIKSVALSNLNKASIQKQLGGNVEQLRKELVKEAMTSADINTFAKELGALIPLLVNITYGLRQVMNPRLPKTPATPVTEDATYAQPGIEGRGEKNVAADPNVNEKDLKLIKAFLTKLNQLSVSLKALNVASPTKEQVKPVIKDILDIFDIINGKLVSGMKVDAQVEALFKDIDLKPTVNIKDGLMLKVKLGNVPNIFKFEKGAWSHRQKDGTFVTVNPNEKRGKEIFDQLTALAKNGQDDTAQIQKDDEEKAKVDKAKKDSDEEQAKLKKADDDKAAAEKDRKAGIERTKAAAAGTRAKATPKTGSDIVKPGEPLSFDKSKFEENFKSDYKNYF